MQPRVLYPPLQLRQPTTLSGLFEYLKNNHNIEYRPKSLRIKYAALEGTMFIDDDTASNLELVRNTVTSTGTQTLFGVLNTCHTPMELKAIEDRLDAVTDLERLITHASLDKEVLDKIAATDRKINILLQLHAYLQQVSRLQAEMKNMRSPLLSQVYTNITELIATCLNLESRVIGTKSTRTRGAAIARLYAVKASCVPTLDIARHTYKENLQEIEACHEQIKSDFDIDCTLDNTGHHFRFTIKSDCFPVPAPKMMQNIERRGANEAIAQIDMLTAFAYNADTRPQFGKYTMIRNGRHPILSTNLGRDGCVPNDSRSSSTHSFHLIQGPNMSGKSTLLRQIALLTIQAMTGSFVPADFATLQLHDALLTRLSNDDMMVKNLSTFASEMTTTSLILGLSTPRTLVLIDEVWPQEDRGSREGLELAKLAALPREVMTCATNIAVTLSEMDRQDRLGSTSGNLLKRRKIMHDLRGALHGLVEHTELNEDSIFDALRELQGRYLQSIKGTLGVSRALE
ncbi:hypothetical protein IAU60_003952 [Kwoniella sp. DSM 27419]